MKLSRMNCYVEKYAVFKNSQSESTIPRKTVFVHVTYHIYESQKFTERDDRRRRQRPFQ